MTRPFISVTKASRREVKGAAAAVSSPTGTGSATFPANRSTSLPTSSTARRTAASSRSHQLSAVVVPQIRNSLFDVRHVFLYLLAETRRGRPLPRGQLLALGRVVAFNLRDALVETRHLGVTLLLGVGRGVRNLSRGLFGVVSRLLRGAVTARRHRPTAQSRLFQRYI